MVEGSGVCTIYLVRHGESEANVRKIVNGHTDFPLTDDGKAQVRDLRKTLDEVEFSAVYSSDLIRARETAEILKGERNIEIQFSTLLRERFFGEFEGVEHAKFIEALKDEFYKFEHDLAPEEMWNHKAHPSMESDGELYERISGVIGEIAAKNPEKNVLVVSHRYAIRMFLVRNGYGEYKNLKDGALKPCGYAIVESDGIIFAVKEVTGSEI